MPSKAGGYTPRCLEGGLSDVLIGDTGGDRGMATSLSDRYSRDHKPRDRKVREGCIKLREIGWGVGSTHLPV
jgi:hypothetical protein